LSRSDTRNEELLRLILRATARARKALLSRGGLTRIVREKPGDFTREADLLAESLLVNTISKRIPCRIVSEELGVEDFGAMPRVVVVLDPLDGTTNFASSIPFYSISACAGFFSGVPTLDDLCVGVVLDVLSGETFQCVKGRGAWLGSRHLKGAVPRDEVLISLYSYGSAVASRKALSLQTSLPNAKFRSLGSAALELCYVAAGRLDAFVDVRDSLRLVDVAAAKIILEEADGTFTDDKGRKPRGAIHALAKAGFSVVATTDERLHRRLMRILAS